MTSVQQTLDSAWQHLQRGQWQQAEQLYLQVLEADPDQIDALHHVGGDRQPDWPKRSGDRLFPGGLATEAGVGCGAQQSGQRVAQPEEVARGGGQLSGSGAPPAGFRGGAQQPGQRACAKQRRPAEAVASLKRALLFKPDFAEAHSNLGIALLEVGRSAEAVGSYQEAMRLKPDCCRRSATTWGLRSGSRESSRRPWPAIGGLCISSRTTPRRTTTWGLPSRNRGSLPMRRPAWSRPCASSRTMPMLTLNLGNVFKDSRPAR